MSRTSADQSLARLDRAFYRRDAARVARELLGQRLVHIRDGVRVAGTIVETEAYLGTNDKAAHSYNGRRTARTETMYADGGTVYVFLNYGIHHLFNVVVAHQEEPQAVLIRALEPTEGLAAIRARRPRARQARDLCSGPGKLGAALAIDLSHDGADLVTSASLFIERARQRPLPKRQIIVGPRIGVDYAGEWAAEPLRFHIAGNIHVSGRS
ncbi:MAG: DNA-3-methyladenine glycosylase [Planctomycetales bacterium]|nr:DNA-3-methyladenine glycosylase [Planctomycetales bacterium]